MTFQIQEHHQLDGQLISEWQKLWDNSELAHGFNGPKWLMVCEKLFPSKELRIITVSDEKGLAAVLPVCRGKKAGIGALVCPGEHHASKTALLTRDNNSFLFAQLFNYLAFGGGFYLSELSAEMANAIKLANLPVVIKEVSKSPYIPLEVDPHSLRYKKLHSRLAARLKKYGKHLRLKSFPASQEALDIAFAIDGMSKKKKEDRATFKTEEDRELFRQMADIYREEFVVDLLFLDNVPIVFSINLNYKKTCHALKTSFREDYKYVAPGRMLSYFMIEQKMRGSLDIINLSRGITALKEEFTPYAFTQYQVFYSRNALIRMWWKAYARVNLTRTRLFDNQSFFGFYLKLKKAFIRIKEKFSFSYVNIHVIKQTK